MPHAFWPPYRVLRTQYSVGTRLRTALFARLALQNLGRRPARTLALVCAVAVGVAAVFATLTLRRAVAESMAAGFSRMGADLLVVPRDTLVHLSSALLTVEPTPHTLDAVLADELARLPGIEQVAPQRHYSLRIRTGGHQQEIDLIAFDPAHDFTVLPWLTEKPDRPLRTGDVLVGARRDEAPGTQLPLAGQTLHVYGRLGATGVGPFDRALFVTFDTAATLAGPEIDGDRSRVSALLVRLAVGATPEQVRFAAARLPGVKVVAGASLLTSVRQVLTALLGGAVFLAALVVLTTMLTVGVMFSAILTERRRELGLLFAVGARGRQVLGLILTEAVVVTSLGGILGVLLGGGLLLLFQRSLGYWFQTVGVPFLWPSVLVLAGYALGCGTLAGVVGLLGALLPAWRASREEPYELVRG